jgi:pyruvate dehydrogenase (quinone)
MVLDANPEFGVDLQPIDFAKYAEAAGAAGFTLTEPKDAEGVLRKALQHDGPVVVEAVVDKNEPPLPGQIKLEQAIHFAEALVRGEKDTKQIVKTIVEDKIREVI